MVAAAALSSEDDIDDDFFEDEEDALERGIDMGTESWAKSTFEALAVTLRLPGLEDLKLYAFKAYPNKRVDIRLDKLTNIYGSPALEDIETVARDLNQRLEAELGEEQAQDIEIDVSTPGADRRIYWDELERFQKLPLVVTFKEVADGVESEVTRIFDIESVNEDGSIVWKLAEVKGNSPGKGRLMNKKMKAQRWTLGEQDISDLRIYIDV